MTTIFDAAKYILDRRGKATAYELQKLCYYAQAWSLALEDNRIFSERFEAWANGPACRELFRRHRGNFTVTKMDIAEGDADNIAPNVMDVIDAVLEMYQGLSGDELREKTHTELPWQYARKGYKEGASCRIKIKEDLMRDYYRTKEEDYRRMEDIMLRRRAERRLCDSRGTKTFAEAMDILGIMPEDIDRAEEADIEEK